MDYKIKYSKEAISELNKAFLWYRSKDVSLGQRFKDAFRKVRLNVKDNPKIFKEIDVNHRRAVLGSSFPYMVHYLIDDRDKVVKIIGVFHQSKNHEIINERLKLEKLHQTQTREKPLQTQQRIKQLENLRQRYQLEKRKDRGLER